ncbi:MAG: H4MPT-linked C1 transfer pathway protein [Methylococcales bacterium]|nr:H4MPT-linked C1 transfer pathway protein [Methylococcales bacterium]
MIVGWDIGGAHIKAALVNDKGIVINVYLQACPLWKGLQFLRQAVNHILSALPSTNYKHALTMTGELVDLFDSRDEGVEQIINAIQNLIGKRELLIYLGQQGFINATLLEKEHYPFIASANWLASASWVAKYMSNALFVDVGSTTTDILLAKNKCVEIQGFSDYQRLQSQELIYTGIVRTAVMSLTQTAIFKGQSIGLMAEYFATMADVYRLTGELNEVHDKTDTADGKEKTPLASAKRLSRMIAYDFEDNELDLWKQFALTLKSYQKQQIQIACQRQLSRVLPNKNTYVIGAGIGRFLVKQIATDLALPYKDFSELFNDDLENSEITIADCAPAVAVAYLSNNL